MTAPSSYFHSTSTTGSFGLAAFTFGIFAFLGTVTGAADI
jgi:hypothetical protein